MKWDRVILTLIPFAWSIGMVPFVNHSKPIVMGLPFLAFWEVSGIFLAFLCIGILYRLDQKEKKR
jgi:hypothetical protein